MVSHKYKCIFVHIPKVAGQSMETFFLNLHGLNWEERAPLLLRSNSNRALGPERLAHLKLNEYEEKQYVSKEIFRTYYKFTFVRNPWSRTVSFYKYGDFDRHMSFRIFVTKKLPALIKGNHFFYQPQYNFIYKNEKTDIDFIGYFEDLEVDFKKVCENISLPISELPYRNKTSKKGDGFFSKKTFDNFIKYPTSIFFSPESHKDYRKYYDDDLINIVGELYQDDVETFGYGFDAILSKS